MAKKKKSVEVPTDPNEIILASIAKMGAHVMNNIDDLAAKSQLSTGLWGLDYALGGKGIPSISVAEIHGPNGVGKTSLALTLTNEAVKKGMTTYYVDTEYAVNDDMSAIFVGQKDVKWIQPESGEKALDIIKFILRETTNSFIVLDSIGGTQPGKIADGDVGDSHVGIQARMFSQFGPVAKVWTKKNNNILLAINQESANLKSTKGGYSLGGGRKWAYIPDLRIRVTKRFDNGDIKDGADIVGHYVEAKVTKNRFGPPMRTADLPLIYGEGFDTEREFVSNATLFGVVKKAGSWYSFDGSEGEVKRQGEAAISAWFRDNPKELEAATQRLTEIVS